MNTVQPEENADATSAAQLPELLEIRGSIDNIDAALMYLLSERFKYTKRVGELKAEHHLPPGDKAREAEQIERLRELARGAHLDPNFAEKFLEFIVAEVIQHHERIKTERGGRHAE